MAIRGHLGDRDRRRQPRASHAAQRPLACAEHRLAALTAAGFLLFARLYTAQLTRQLYRPRPPDTQTEPQFKEATVRPSSAVGIDGHQWNVQCAPRARLPCRAICECGWTSTAGQRTRVLLELKGHLEETLRNGE